MQILAQITWTDWIGLVGTVIILAAYFATQVRYLSSDDLAFPVANLIGAALILFSLWYDFNLASFLLEVSWVLISLVGIVSAIRSRGRRG